MATEKSKVSEVRNWLGAIALIITALFFIFSTSQSAKDACSSIAVTNVRVQDNSEKLYRHEVALAEMRKDISYQTILLEKIDKKIAG